MGETCVPPTVDARNVEPPLSLWVDDRLPEIQRLRLMLRRFGLRVRTAASSEKAKGEVRDRPFDLLLMDLRLDESNGIEVMRYARKIADQKYQRSIHFIAVTNFKDAYAEELRNNDFTFVYEKGELKNGKSKTFVEDCLFSAADSRIRADYPVLKEKPPLKSVDPKSFEHVCCDVGYVLRLEYAEVLARLWRCGDPRKRAIRVFDRSFLGKRGVREEGQPFRIDTFEGREDKAHVTLITPLHEAKDRSRRRIASEIDLERFREGTGE